jgi:hypothetical protein
MSLITRPINITNKQMHSLHGNIILSKLNSIQNNNNDRFKLRIMAFNFGFPWVHLYKVEKMILNNNPDIIMISEIECFQEDTDKVKKYFRNIEYVGIGSAVHFKKKEEENLEKETAKGIPNL